MTDKFASAAELMRQVLGAYGYPFAVINHPISSATPAELTLQAQQAAAACVNILTRTTSARPNGNLAKATGANESTARQSQL